jgi:L-asparaginase
MYGFAGAATSRAIGKSGIRRRQEKNKMTITRPRVLVINCGGTIASLGTSSFDVMDYAEYGQKIAIEDIVARVPELGVVAEVEPVAFRNVSSSAITAADWMDLRRLIQDRCGKQPAVAGVVILHGTGTLEETAFFLHLTANVQQPIVLVGAQRPLSAISSDGPMNLLNAVRVATHEAARGRGVLVVMNDEVHSGRDVVKISTYRMQAFRALDFGMLGQVDGDGVHFMRTVDGIHTGASPFARIGADATFPRVDIIYAHIGADEVFIDAAVKAGAGGLICAGMAPGLTTPAAKHALERLAAADFPIVMCSRAGSGRVAPRRYLLDHNMIQGEDLSPQKARILLMLCLARGLGVAETRQRFAEV